VPQQPIFGGMVEDEAISYTFEQFLKTGDETWPLLLPMVKSAVRAMDTVQTIARDEWKLDVQGFTLTGASKRGWTTWLTGAVDARATAIAPMVIDVLNMDDQMRHQLASWGKFSEEIQDYTDRDIQSQNESEQGKVLRAIVDPYAYRAVLTQPKLILLGTNDRYWPLDALNLYWSELPDEKHVLYVPNNGHGLKDLARVMGSTVALHKRATGRLKLPELAWSLEEAPEHLHLNVTSDVAPDKVSAWIATAPTRDFRDAKWTSLSTTARDKGYEHKLARPEAGFAAMFGEAVYSDGGLPYFLSTNVRIISSETTAGGR
jgi:PhoPQ-activated pathogenicity-related protein